MIDELHFISENVYGNTYKNWETAQRLLSHYDVFSQILPYF
jgi:hypothetical protein